MTDAAIDAPRSTLRRVLQGVISVTLVVLLFAWALPRMADYAAIWGAIRSMSLVGIVALAGAAFANLLTYWWVQVVVLPGLTYPKAAVAHQASTALAHAVPGGGAIAVGLTYAMYSSWGFGPAAIARSVLVSGLWNNLAKFAFPVVALALLAFGGGASAALVATAAFGLALLVGTLVTLGLALRSDRLIRALGRAAAAVASAPRRLVGRPPVGGWEEGASRFRTDAAGMLHSRWIEITVATVASQTAIFLVLLAALRALDVTGSEVGWVEAFAAFSFVRLASALPLTPGGLGIVELGLLAALTSGLAEPAAAQVAAAVLVFRFVTYVLPVATGAVAYLAWRRVPGLRPQGLVTTETTNRALTNTKSYDRVTPQGKQRE